MSDAGEVLRIDRLVHLDDPAGAAWWVLDYKLRLAPDRLAPYRRQSRRYPATSSRAPQPGGDGPLRVRHRRGRGSSSSPEVQRFTARSLTFRAFIAPSAVAPVRSNQATSSPRDAVRCRPCDPSIVADGRLRALRPAAAARQERADDGLARHRHAHRRRGDAVDAAPFAGRRGGDRPLAADGAARRAARASEHRARSPSAACTSTGRTSPSIVAPA